MGHDMVQFRQVSFSSCYSSLQCFRKNVHRELVDLFPIHSDELWSFGPFCNNIVHREIPRVETGSFGAIGTRYDASYAVSFCKDRGTCSISKEHTGGSVREIRDLGKHFTSYDKNMVNMITLQQSIRHFQSVDESAARRIEIETGRIHSTQLILNVAAGVGHQCVRGGGCNKNIVYIFCADPCILKSGLCSLISQISGILRFIGEMPLPDSSPCYDPLICGIHICFHFFVCHDAFRQITACSDDSSHK